MPNTAPPGADHLVALGFTPLEAEVYVFLLREAPATGYRVAQGIGRTVANTYKALESLERRGAAMADAGDPRLYRAAPPVELLRAMERAFLQRRARAEEVLGQLGGGPMDDGVYQLSTPAQVFERCRAALVRARHVALLDIFPTPLAELRDAVAGAVARGVRVGLLVYEPTELEGATVVLNHQAAVVRGRWARQWANVAVDAAEQVHAVLTHDGASVLHATWSASAFLAHLYQSGLLGELTASAVRTAVRAGATPADLPALLARMDALEHVDTPAFAALTTPPLRPAGPRGRKRP